MRSERAARSVYGTIIAIAMRAALIAEGDLC